MKREKLLSTRNYVKDKYVTGIVSNKREKSYAHLVSHLYKNICLQLRKHQ